MTTLISKLGSGNATLTTRNLLQNNWVLSHILTEIRLGQIIKVRTECICFIVNEIKISQIEIIQDTFKASKYISCPKVCMDPASVIFQHLK